MRTSSGAMITSAVSRAVLLGILSVVIGLARNVVETKPTTAGGGNSPTAYKPASSSSFPSQKSSSSSNMAPAVSTMAPLTADIIGNLTLLDSKFSVPLVPALFGDPLKSSGSSDSRNDGTRFTSSSPARGLAALVTPTPDSSVNGCRPIKFNSDDFLDQIYMLLENYNVPVDEKINIILMLPRGKCSFETKAYYAQVAGFDSVIVHNTASFRDVPIRMAASTLNDLHIPSFFLTNADYENMMIHAATSLSLLSSSSDSNNYKVEEEQEDGDNDNKSSGSPPYPLPPPTPSALEYFHSDSTIQIVQLTSSWNFDNGNSSWQWMINRNQDSSNFQSVPDILWLASIICFMFPMSITVGRLMGICFGIGLRGRRRGGGGRDDYDDMEMKRTLKDVNHLTLRVLTEADFKRRASATNFYQSINKMLSSTSIAPTPTTTPPPPTTAVESPTSSSSTSSVVSSTTTATDLHPSSSLSSTTTSAANITSEEKEASTMMITPTTSTFYSQQNLYIEGADCCAICIDEFTVGSRVRQLPCKHLFHDTCVDPWLTQQRSYCPTCKREIDQNPSFVAPKPTLTQRIIRIIATNI